MVVGQAIEWVFAACVDLEEAASRFYKASLLGPVRIYSEDETQRTLLRAGGRGLFIGSPEFVRENLRRYEDAHVDLMNWQIQGGFRKHEHIMETIEMFAKEVMPEFQERHHLHEKWREQQLDGIKHPVNSTI